MSVDRSAAGLSRSHAARASGNADGAYAAFGSAALACANAQSSHGVSASTSERLDRRAAPDAQARRRVAMRRDVVGGAFLLEQRDQVLREGPCASAESAVIAGSTIFRHTEVLERVFGRLGEDRDPRRLARPSRAITLALASARARQALQPADRLRPGERVEIILDAEHRGRVDGLALEDAVD